MLMNESWGGFMLVFCIVDNKKDMETMIYCYDFFNKKLSIFSGGSPRLDSHFSESLAADYYDFNLDHINGYDGYTSNNESCEVKGTSYTNSRVRFSMLTPKAKHIFWVKANGQNRTVDVLEINVDYNGLNKDGFINSDDTKHFKIIKNHGSLSY